jgi:hypothetical protein
MSPTPRSSRGRWREAPLSGAEVWGDDATARAVEVEPMANDTTCTVELSATVPARGVLLNVEVWRHGKPHRRLRRHCGSWLKLSRAGIMHHPAPPHMTSRHPDVTVRLSMAPNDHWMASVPQSAAEANGCMATVSPHLGLFEPCIASSPRLPRHCSPDRTLSAGTHSRQISD